MTSFDISRMSPEQRLALNAGRPAQEIIADLERRFA
jgi:hypothetical protein